MWNVRFGFLSVAWKHDLLISSLVITNEILNILVEKVKLFIFLWCRKIAQSIHTLYCMGTFFVAVLWISITATEHDAGTNTSVFLLFICFIVLCACITLKHCASSFLICSIFALFMLSGFYQNFDISKSNASESHRFPGQGKWKSLIVIKNFVADPVSYIDLIIAIVSNCV